jgi:hypothetical protein
MKQSHYTTPRSMTEAEFQPWGQAIYGDEQPEFDREDLIVMWGCVGAALALVAMAFGAWLS